MIPVVGYQGRKVAVLGLGRSGLATARALEAGGAEALLWDDSPESRAKAEAEGFALTDLSRQGAVEGVALLVISVCFFGVIRQRIGMGSTSFRGW